MWLHVDGAYGGAALLAPSARHRFRGIEHADSLVVDPHKWLYAPFDCAALIYREPQLARAFHTQEASYLEVIHERPTEWNPSDYAFHLTRRARGLPLWFSLAVHGSDAYRDAIEQVLTTARAAAARIAATPDLELDTRARAVDRSLPAPRLGARRLPTLVGRPAHRADRVRRAVAAGTARPSPGSRSCIPRRRSSSSTRSSRPWRSSMRRQHAPQRPRPARRASSSSASIVRAWAPLGAITRSRARPRRSRSSS